MKAPLILLGVAACGVVGGAWLVGRWAVGVAIIADSVALAVLALFWQRPDPPPPTFEERAAAIAAAQRAREGVGVR